MSWSKEQETAIHTHGKNILVAAAAGSGKTAVLVERIIQLILNNNVDISEILVVTFTNAAASEMRERIGRQLEGHLSQAAQHNDADMMKKLERQLVLLNAASISTLHAFCQNILRRHFHEIDIDPKFRLAGEQETTLLKQDVLTDLIKIQYEQENNDLFLQFADSYGNERGDEAVCQIILNIYEYAMSQPFPYQWLNSLPDFFTIPQDKTIDDTKWTTIIRSEIQSSIDECTRLNSEMQKTAGQTDYVIKAITADEVLLETIRTAVTANWHTLYTVMNTLNFSTMRLPADMDETTKNHLKETRQTIKTIVNTLRDDFFLMPPDKMLDDIRNQKNIISFIADFTIKFMTAYDKAKHEHIIVDFNDLEHFTLQILAAAGSTEKHLIPTNTAINISKKYREVMVDEYQDTNGVQEAIINLVSGKNFNKFLVGDVKQSIYRFRMADPGLFMEKYLTYPQKSDQCIRIDLSQNFRSRSNILQSINFIFAQTMTQQATELDYGKKEAFSPGIEYPVDKNSLDEKVELLLIDNGSSVPDEKAITDNDVINNKETLTGFAAEADCIAKRIKQLMQQNHTIYDKQSNLYRPLIYRDIVILLRSMTGKADVMLETLRNNDIPSYASANGGYFAETEIKIMLALLQILDNPRQDIPLAAVLYSPIVNFSTQELAQIRLCQPTGNLFEALMQSCNPQSGLDEPLKEKTISFLSKLTHWRSLSRQRSVPELIWQLYDETGYYDYCGGMPGGLLRQANLRMLYDRAAAYEETDYRGLFRFLQFIGKMKKSGNDLSVARTLGENENVVRIMSIHKSKGLEFPVVIIADLGKKMNLTDSRQALLIHKNYGLGPYIYNLQYNSRYPTLARQAIARQIMKESKAEELRILYVAMTRAREKLILTGTVRNLPRQAEKWCHQNNDNKPTLSSYQILSAGSYLDWICPALSRHSAGTALYRLWNDQMVDDIPHLDYDDSQWNITIHSANADSTKEKPVELTAIFNKLKKHAPLATTVNKSWVDKRLAWHYPHLPDSHIPSKLSVTEIKRRFSSEDENAVNIFVNNEYTRPRFLQKKSTLTGIEYGTLMHTVMQHLDLTDDLSKSGIKMQLNQMARTEIIAPENIPQVNQLSIYNFIYSKLGQRMLISNKIRREMQFSRMLDAVRFYNTSPTGSKIFIQGVVDLLFDEPDGLVLIDYKTDNCNPAEAKDKYNIQINLYSEAVQSILNKPVKEKYLYLFHNSEIVQIN
ncbi:helicase-exonuclease AddAB subunit AddA [Pectinatus frisingensis]|uniref:helicase-exonuclease AddAB subunit AddA n=1 Tax=Pectinatus frisingensis TaxID=865 RepID=UPI003D80A3DD